MPGQKWKISIKNITKMRVYIGPKNAWVCPKLCPEGSQSASEGWEEQQRQQGKPIQNEDGDGNSALGNAAGG